VPKLSDKLIGTSVGGEIEDVTYNFTLQELLDVFLPVIPANNLQGILDYGNTATQDINLFGTITTTNLSVTDTANLFITYLNEETHLVGSLFDSADSVGTAGQVLTSTGEGVEWYTLPPIFTPNLQQVLEVGNTAEIDILLDANIQALDVSSDTANVSSQLTIQGVVVDYNESAGGAGQVLSSTSTSVEWVNLPVYSATSPLLFNPATGVFSIQVANSTQNGYLSSADWITFNGKQNAGSYITALTGEATATGPGSAAITLNNSSVINKVLTGLNVTGGNVLATDSILTAFGKVQNQINGLVGGVQYQGTWDAATNTPTLTSSVGTQGYYYIVSVDGNTNLNGITDWKVGDWAIFSGGVWQKVDNTDSVTSVNGFTGAVSLTTDNIPEGTTNLYYLNSRARAALSFVAGSGAYNNTTGVITIPTNNNQILNGANYIVLGSLSANSPLSYNNTTGVFSIQVSNSTQNGYLSSTDWSTFNGKQGAITLTTTGSSGPSTLVGNTLNIPDYGGALTGYVPYTGATGPVNLGAYDLTVQTLTIGKGNSSLANNTALGYHALFHITTGNYNTAVGYESSHNITTGQYNTTLGQSALFTNTTGSQNTAIGLNALLYNTSGGSNVVVGLDAMQHNTTGSSNTALGYNAGSHITGGSTPNTTASNSIYIGRDTKALADGGTNEIVIGNAVTGNGSNTVTIGNSSVVNNYFTGSIHGGSFIRLGGTASQFLKANGSIDSNAYITLTSLSASAPLSYNNTTGAFSISQATTSTDGYLSSTDWNTFNNKQGAITLTTTGTSGAATLVGNTLNIPQYQSVLTNPITGTGTSGQIAYFNGTNSITSNAAFAFTPTSQLLVNNSVTAASAIARGTNLTPTLTAAANNDVLVGLDINPTFTNGAFTGVSNIGLLVRNGRVGFGTSTPLYNLDIRGSGLGPANPISVNIQNSNSGGESYIGIRNDLNYYAAFEVFGSTWTDNTLLRNTALLSSGSGITNLAFITLSTANISFRTNSTGTSNERLTIFGSTGNVGINQNADAGFRLDVNGTARVQGNTQIVGDLSVPSGNYISVNGTGGIFGLRIQSSLLNVTAGNTNLAAFDQSLGSGALSLRGSANNNVSGNFIQLQVGNTASSALTSNAGTANYTAVNITSGYNITGGTHNIIGIYYDPTLTSMTGVTHRAIQTVTGDVLLCTTSGNVAIGTSTLATATELTLGGSQTASSAIARGGLINTTLIASANNDVLVGLDINPTFTNGAFTGVKNLSIRVGNSYGQYTSALGHGVELNTNVGILGSLDVGGDSSVLYLWRSGARANGNVIGSAYTSPSFNHLYFGTTVNKQMVLVTSNGNLILQNGGTFTDAGFRLDVNGTARVQGFTTINAAPSVNADSALTINANTAASSSGQLYGIRSIATVSSTNTGNVNGINSEINNPSTATSMTGFNSAVNVSANTTATANGYSVGSAVIGTGTISNFNGYDYRDLFKAGSGAVSRQIALRIANLTAGSSANIGILFNNSAGTSVNGTWDIYSQSGNNSYLAGSIGIGASTINASAQLQVDSTIRGFLPPRMTLAQRTAIASPATGLIVYQTDGVEGLWLRTSTGWVELTVV
jgi:hypothetical protein